jgi:uncharacterized protein (TIGR02453 family)
MNSIPPSSFLFLKKLAKNNNRDWFNQNKELYQSELETITAFADSLLFEMQKHDNIETPSGKKSLHRIYRDTRFAKDKTPYKDHWSGSFKRATKLLRGGYYFHLQPGNSFVAGGFWGPNPEDLKRIRQELAADPGELRKILKSRSFKETFSELRGEKLTTAPQGYTSDHPAIDLLRYKQFLLHKDFSDEEVFSSKFPKTASDTFKKMRPFLDYMSEVLSTDANGHSIY